MRLRGALLHISSLPDGSCHPAALAQVKQALWTAFPASCATQIFVCGPRAGEAGAVERRDRALKQAAARQEHARLGEVAGPGAPLRPISGLLGHGVHLPAPSCSNSCPAGCRPFNAIQRFRMELLNCPAGFSGPWLVPRSFLHLGSCPAGLSGPSVILRFFAQLLNSPAGFSGPRLILRFLLHLGNCPAGWSGNNQSVLRFSAHLRNRPGGILGTRLVLRFILQPRSCPTGLAGS